MYEFKYKNKMGHTVIKTVGAMDSLDAQEAVWEIMMIAYGDILPYTYRKLY